MPTALRFMALGLHLGLEWADNFDEDFLEVLLGIFFAELREGAFGQKLAVVNDADDVAELFDFAHDVRGEDDGFAAVAAFADKGGDGAGGHDVRPRVGSSKIITGGSWTKVRAMEVFCFMPVESLSQRRSRKPFMSRRLKISSRRFLRVASSRPFRRPKYSTIS